MCKHFTAIFSLRDKGTMREVRESRNKQAQLWERNGLGGCSLPAARPAVPTVVYPLPPNR